MFSNGLSLAEAERLALLVEECGEVQQIIGKVLRHGYESRWPLDGKTNRERLEDELGDLFLIYELFCNAKDLNPYNVLLRKQTKVKKLKKWVHHQEGVI